MDGAVAPDLLYFLHHCPSLNSNDLLGLQIANHLINRNPHVLQCTGLQHVICYTFHRIINSNSEPLDFCV